LTELPTPFYLFDESRFADNIVGFRTALERHWPKVIVAYSIKTNYVPGLCALARDLGCVGEAVSRMELELAQRLKFPPNRIIFNGPLKSASDLQYAIGLGAVINLDSLAQVSNLLSLARPLQLQARVGLRLNVDLTKGQSEAHKIAAGGKVPRFGLPHDDAHTAVAQLNEAGVSVISLHGHANSSDRMPQNYGKIAEQLAGFAEQHQLPLKLLDVGGGFAGQVPEIWNLADSHSYQDYADAIFQRLLQSSWFNSIAPHVVVEPGMSVVADCMNYFTRVVAEKTVLGVDLLGVDGNFFDVRPTLHQKPLPCHVYERKAEPGDKPHNYTITGSTCMERDILLDSFTFPSQVQLGDLLEITHLGAYTTVLSPHFINYAPAIFARNKHGALHEWRRPQVFDDFFGCYSFGE